MPRQANLPYRKKERQERALARLLAKPSRKDFTPKNPEADARDIEILKRKLGKQ